MGKKSRQKRERQERRQWDQDVLHLGMPEGMDPTRHAYVRKLKQMYEAGLIPNAPGRVSSIAIAHDDGCGVFVGTYCDCDPEIHVTLFPAPEDN